MRLLCVSRSQVIAGTNTASMSSPVTPIGTATTSKTTSASMTPVGSSTSSQTCATSSCASSTSTATLVPSNLLFTIWSAFPHLATYEQHDAHELLVALLEGLSSHLHDFHGESNAVLQAYADPKGMSIATCDSKSRLPSDANTINRLLQLGATSALCAINSNSSKSDTPKKLDSISPNVLSESERKTLLRQVQSTGLFKFEGIVNEVTYMVSFWLTSELL
jgi:hypothetical protein